jgi:hypothetical protein
MVAHIHDEVIMYINDDVKTVLMADAKIKEIMGTPPLPNFPVPIVGESAIGYTWKEKISIEEWQKRKAV